MRHLFLSLTFLLLTTSTTWAQCYCDGEQKECLPMHVEFLDAPNIINDNTTTNTLRIGVFNSQETTGLGANANDLVLKQGVPLYVWFIVDDRPADQESGRPWGLTTSDYIFKADVSVEGTTAFKIDWSGNSFYSTTYRESPQRLNGRPVYRATAPQGQPLFAYCYSVNSSGACQWVLRADTARLDEFAVAAHAYGPNPWEALTTQPNITATLNQAQWKSWEKSENIIGRPDLKGYALTPAQDVTLKPGEHITVNISGLRSNLPSGPTTAFFSYTHEDTGRYCPYNATFGPVQKSPIYITQQQVGIGTNQTNAADMNVSGGIRVQNGALQAGGNNNVGYAFSTDAGSTGIGSPQSGQVDIYANGKALVSFKDTKTESTIAVNGALWVKEGISTKLPQTMLEPNKAYAIAYRNGVGYVAFDGGYADPTQIGLAGLHGGNTQQFNFISAGNGYYELVSSWKGKAIGWNGQKYVFQITADAFKPVRTGPMTFKLESKAAPGQYLRADLIRVAEGQATEFYIVPTSGDNNPNLIPASHTTYARFGEQGQYQYQEVATGTFGKPGFVLDAPADHSVGFYSAGTSNLEVNSSNGDLKVRGNTTVGQQLNVGGNIRVKNAAPIIFRRIYITNLENNGSSRDARVDTGIPAKDYVGVIGGYTIDAYDARDDDKGRMSMEIFDSGNENLRLKVEVYADQPIGAVSVNAIFFRKELVEVRPQITINQ